MNSEMILSLKLWAPLTDFTASLTLTLVPARADFLSLYLQHIFFLGPSLIIIVFGSRAGAGMSYREQHRSSQCTLLAVTFFGIQLFNSGFLRVYLWQDLPQRHRTWYTTSTRPPLAWSGTHRQTQAAAMTSPTGLYAGAAAGSRRSAFHVGRMWDTLLRSPD